MNLNVSAMCLNDLDDVCELERLSFPTPWSKDSFRDELTNNSRATYLMVRDEGGAAVAYGGFWLVFDEAHVTNVAVHPAFRRRGIGRRLMIALMCSALAKGALRMTLEVRVSNCGAQQLYRQLGFVGEGVRRGYYLDTREDALVMWVSDLRAAVAGLRLGSPESEGCSEQGASDCDCGCACDDRAGRSGGERDADG